MFEGGDRERSSGVDGEEDGKRPKRYPELSEGDD